MAQWTSAVGAAQLARQLQRPAAAARPGPAPAGRPPTARSPTASGCSCSRAGSRSPPGSPPNANWRWRSSVSRTTVAAAYEALRAEGFLESRTGRGQLDRGPGR